MADLVVTLTVPEAKIDDFRIPFFAELPIPVDFEGNPQATELQWFKYCLRQFVLGTVRRGLEKIATDSITVDDTIIQ